MIRRGELTGIRERPLCIGKPLEEIVRGALRDFPADGEILLNEMLRRTFFEKRERFFGSALLEKNLSFENLKSPLRLRAAGRGILRTLLRFRKRGR